MTYGTYRFTSGKEYNGEFNNGNFSGQGTMYNQDGTWIEGLFRDDDVNGYAVEYGWSDTTYEDYVIYEGDWQDGEYHGYGVKYFDDGTVDYEGDWKGGKPAK